MEELSTVAGCQFRGTISSWKAKWGWVNCADLGSDFFVHAEDIVSGVLSKGAQVSFEVGTDPKSGRPRAKQIQVIAEATAEVYGPRVEGVVASWREPWGWFSCAGEEKEIFAHREDIISPGAVAPLEPGTAVTFHVGADPKSGRRRALRIELPMQEGRLHGIVTTWKDRWGWVKSAEVTDGDIFAHTEDMPPGLCPQPGQGITFELGTDGKGRRRARKVHLLMEGIKGSGCNAGMMMNARAPTAMGKGLSAGAMCAPLQGQAQLGAAAFQQGQSQRGVAAFQQGQAQRGAAAFQQGHAQLGAAAFQRGHAQLGAAAFQQGQGQLGGAAFQQGQVQLGAAAFQQGQAQLGAAAFQQGQTQCGATAFQQAPMPQAPAASHGAAAALSTSREGAAQFLGQRMTGTVMSWKDRWGWINVQGLSGDLFAHLEDIPAGTPLIPGSQVAFTVGRDQQGRVRARQIQVGQLPVDGSAGLGKKRKTAAVFDEGMDGQALEGEVVSWKSPWGWIRAPGIDGDIFAHKDDSGGEDLVVGHFVSFIVGRDPKSRRWRARSIGASEMGAEASTSKRPRTGQPLVAPGSGVAAALPSS